MRVYSRGTRQGAYVKIHDAQGIAAESPQPLRKSMSAGFLKTGHENYGEAVPLIDATWPGVYKPIMRKPSREPLGERYAALKIPDSGEDLERKARFYRLRASGKMRPKSPKNYLTSAALLCLLFFLCGGFLAADFPRIQKLEAGDVIFRQFQEDIERYNKAESRNEAPPPLSLYSYVAAQGENVFDLGARLTLSLEALATLNGLDRSTSPIEGKTLLIPGVPGIFLREAPANTLERIMASWRDPKDARKLTIGGEVFYFFPGERFHHVERIFFLNALFGFPLDTRVISSQYGTRVSPITGRVHFHSGLDLAAPRGSNVYAARAGIVTRKGCNATLGNHIVIAHSGNFETVYGHLDSFDVELNQTVNSSILIGRVGSTGASTGPHLHFEVREKGVPRNPLEILPKRIQK